ncbi:UNVERIFIED_CONTAM: hypothetical protein HDU68_005872, partial [Siphonaria sp. JEL0065]
MCTADEFDDLIRKRAIPVKAFLLDQSVLAGVGNLYADEILYQAKIHPSQYTQTLTDVEITQVYNAVVDVMETACNVNADSSQFPDTWLFHHRYNGKKKSKKAPTLPDGSLIEFETVGGRTSAFVPSQQILREGESTKKKSTPTKKKTTKKRKAEESE